jgi:twitching motility protein PilJ
MAFELPFSFKKKKGAPTSQQALPDTYSPETHMSYSDLRNMPVPGARALNMRLPFIGHRPRAWQERFLTTFLFFSIVFGVVFALAQWQRAYLTTYQTKITSDAQQHYQNLTSAAQNALLGKPDAIPQLEASYNGFNKSFGYLQALHRGTAGSEETGGGRTAYKASPALIAVGLKVARTWVTLENSAKSILSVKDELSEFSSAIQKINVYAVSTPKLAAQIANTITQANSSADDEDAAERLRIVARRLERGKTDLLTSEGIDGNLALSLSKDLSAARSITDGFLVGGSTERLSPDGSLRAHLARLQEILSQYQQALSSVIASQQYLATTKVAAQKIQAASELMKDNLYEMKNLYFEELQETSWYTYAMLGCIGLALFSLGCYLTVQIQGSADDAVEAEKRRQDAEYQRQEALRLEVEARELNARNQEAILRLMNELQVVADGDLTIQATVSEDITGAIADSINYTVEELRELVGRVTTTAQQVNDASESAAKTSSELISASQQQSREIEDATQMVLQMADDINNVSRSANESAEVARQSLMVASQGAAAVQNTIKGMNEIRDQIQETAKRIKRLGESSQEIGEITELISDITEQTNVLALNAAIQAASAGEAGRGFSVVAEEVQRLAERSAEATKQIGALVRTIQTDTHDAVAAMENSTQGVVEGAKLSDAAGAALADISRVSNQLAELIQGISSSSQRHAATANGLAQNIQHILGITEQTQHGTEQTANSIHQLSILAEELRNSVSRFRVTT